MVNFISSKWFSLSLIMHVHQIGGGFFRNNDPEHMTAPLELEDLDPGSYDELIKYNPSLAPFENNIRYGGDPNKPFDWLAPEIGSQVAELVTEPDESIYRDDTAKILKEIRDETDITIEKNRDETNIFAGINRDEIAKIIREVRDDADSTEKKNRDKTDITIEKNRNETNIFVGMNRDEIAKILREVRGKTDITTEKNRDKTNITTEKSKDQTVEIAEKNKNETDIIQEKIKEKIREKHPNSQFLVNWPEWLGNKNKTSDVQENKTNAQKNIGRNNWIYNETNNKKTDSRSRARILDLSPVRARQPTFNTSNKKILRKQVWPKLRTYRVYVPWEHRTRHDHHIVNWNWKNDTHDYYLSGVYSASCYSCGLLNYGKWWRPSVERRERNRKVIPTGKLCYEAFQGDDWRYRTKARLMRSRCYSNEPQKWRYEIGDDNYNYYHECVSPEIYPWLINRTYDYGNALECFGRYTGRCFKRFLDVGPVYTERGCASWPPHQSNSFASHRFTKMEYLLYRKDNACVSSPLASLTPFARGISLYVRYHVCVCTGKFCNAATNFTVGLLLLFTVSFVTLAYGSCWL